MVQAVVDGISDDQARVVIGNDAVAVYISLRELPPGTREGTVLRVTFSIDHAATKARASSPKTGYGAE